MIAFEKYPIGENCPKERIVETLHKCKAASAVLGLDYDGYKPFKNNRFDRPAGCFWEGEYSYFNAVVDPSQTRPDDFGPRGGVCVKGKF